MLRNNPISLPDTAFHDANRPFTDPARAGGSEKWVDFADAFRLCACACGPIVKAFLNAWEESQISFS